MTRNSKTSSPSSRADVHQAVTDRIIKMLEVAQANGFEMPWCRPGVAHSRPTNALSKQRYRGINILSLWTTADASNYRTGLWATYKQWQELGAQVRKGESATPIVFYKPLEVANEKADFAAGDDPTKTIRMVRGYWGFNADQVDGFQLPNDPVDNLVTRIARAEEFFSRIGVDIRHGGARAFYRPSDDFIQMPELRLFRDTKTSSATEGYYAVLGHEAGHATGAKHRLARDLSGRFGTAAYGLEELIALSGQFSCGLSGQFGATLKAF
ncbi:MAG: ArdC-like ssDNA-binding domain-containing protein [Hyphomicrobium sp.]